jgi:hypothetical protein
LVKKKTLRAGERERPVAELRRRLQPSLAVDPRCLSGRIKSRNVPRAEEHLVQLLELAGVVPMLDCVVSGGGDAWCLEDLELRLALDQGVASYR